MEVIIQVDQPVDPETGGPETRPSGGASPPLLDDPSNSGKPSANWIKAFPHYPSLLVRVRDDVDTPVEVRVKPPPQQSTKHTLQEFQTLNSYPAQPLQRLSLEAFLLDRQLQGLEALSRDMKKNLEDVHPAAPEWKSLLNQINTLLQKTRADSKQLYYSVIDPATNGSGP